MLHRMCSQNVQLVKQVEDPKALKRARIWDSWSKGANSNNEYGSPQGRDENRQTKDDQLMDVMEKTKGQGGSGTAKFLTKLSRKVSCVDNRLVFQTFAYKIVETLMPEAADELDDRVINFTNQRVVDSLETYDVVRNKVFTKSALRCALNALLVLNLITLSCIWKSMENAMIQLPATSES